MLKILGVHGVKNHQAGLAPPQAAELLAGWWNDALHAGMKLADGDGLSVDVSYYAHHLHRGTAQGDHDPGLLGPEVQQMIVSWAELCGAPRSVPQGKFSVPARAAIEWVADKFGLDHRAARILASVFFREVHTYFTDDTRRTAAATTVADAIARTRPRVVIAHSLGSAVAYDALWAHAHPPVDLLLTVGSPLAMPDIVFDRLAPHEGARGRPPGVARWVNVADPGDVIAVPSGGIPRSFENVAANLTDAIGAFSFHQVTKYLRCGATAGVLSGYLP